MDIHAAARAAGILAEYFDARGQHQHVPIETLQRLLDALPHSSAQSEGPIVRRVGTGAFEIESAEQLARWRLWNGETLAAEGDPTDGRVRLPDLAAGVYRLEFCNGDGTIIASRAIVVAPDKAFQGDFDRVWVLAVQLYSVRSERNWGIGDFTDLRRLLELASTLGCAGVGLNPLHALFDDEPQNCSPYAPSSRLFLNPIYIDVEAVPEFTGIDAAT